ncbi:hypothetical protein BJX64DRAFT_246900 [Aspergillus heterothallicus]
MRTTSILIAGAAVSGALAADQIVSLNLPTDIASTITAVDVITSTASRTSYSIPCYEATAWCSGGMTFVVEPSAYTMLASLSDDIIYTAACDIDTSASTDSCSVRTGTDDTWEGIGTDDIAPATWTITGTVTPASNSAVSTTPASTTITNTNDSSASSTASTTSTESADASSSSVAVDTTDSDDAAIAMMTGAPWAGAVVAGFAVAVAMV